MTTEDESKGVEKRAMKNYSQGCKTIQPLYVKR